MHADVYVGTVLVGRTHTCVPIKHPLMFPGGKNANLAEAFKQARWRTQFLNINADAFYILYLPITIVV